MKNTRNLVIGLIAGSFFGAISYPMFFAGSTITAASNSVDMNFITNSFTDKDRNMDAESYHRTRSTTRNINTLDIKNRDIGVRKGINEARGITRYEADHLFQQYHQNRDPDLSRGELRVTIDGEQEVLTHFFLSYDKVVLPLVNKLSNVQDSTLVGFSGLLAYDDSEHSHTMIWVAVVQDDNNKYHYYLPANNQPDNTSHIYDFIDVCPKDCPENYNQLWNEDWER